MIIVMHYIYIYYGYTTRVLLLLARVKYAYFVAGAIFLILCIPLSIKLFYHTALYLLRVGVWILATVVVVL